MPIADMTHDERLSWSLRLTLAGRVEARAAERRAARPAPRNETERLRFRWRDYDARARAVALRRTAAHILAAAERRATRADWLARQL